VPNVTGHPLHSVLHTVEYNNEWSDGVNMLMMKEQGELQSSVQETLALLVDCFTDADAARLAQLEALVLQNIEQVVSFPLVDFLAHCCSCPVISIFLSFCALVIAFVLHSVFIHLFVSVA